MNYFDDKKRLEEEKKIQDNLLQSQGYCIICNHADPYDLEFHHIGGRSNNSLLVSMCRNCHGKVSRMQRFWPKGWSDKSKSQELKDAFLLRGMSDLLRVMSDYRRLSIA